MSGKTFIFSLFVLLASQLVVTAQPVVATDSLLTILGKHKKKDAAKVDLLNEVAYSYYKNNADYEKTRKYAIKAIGLAEKISYTPGIARGYNISGIAHMYAEEYYPAFVMFKKAESLYAMLGDTLRLGYVYGNMALVSSMVQDLDNTGLYGNKLLDLSIQTNNTPEIAKALYFILHQIRISPDNKLMQALNTVVADSSYTSDYKYVCVCFYAIFLSETGKNTQAMEYLQQARKIFNNLPKNPETVAGMDRVTAQIYLNQNRVDSALFYTDRYSHISVPDSLEQQLIVNEFYAHIDSLKGDYLNAYKHYQARTKAEISIRERAQSLEIAQMKAWNEIEQREAEYQILRLEKNTQKNMIILLCVALIVVILLISLLVFYYKRRMTDNRLLKQTNKELQELHGVKDKLFTLVAHDLRSPIATLSSLLKIISQKGMDADAQEVMFKELSHKVDDTYLLLNNLLHWSKTQMKGINPLPKYFDIQEL